MDKHNTTTADTRKGIYIVYVAHGHNDPEGAYKERLEVEATDPHEAISAIMQERGYRQVPDGCASTMTVYNARGVTIDCVQPTPGAPAWGSDRVRFA